MTDGIRVFESKVLGIAQEHWTMAMLPCACGEAWTKGPQALTPGPSGPVDEWAVHCGACGARAVFRFDVSGFFDHPHDVERWVEERLPEADDRLRARIVRKIGPPFGTRFLSVVQGLAKDGEVASLLYLRAEIDRALAAVQAAGGSADGGGGPPGRIQ